MSWENGFDRFCLRSLAPGFDPVWSNRIGHTSLWWLILLKTLQKWNRCFVLVFSVFLFHPLFPASDNELKPSWWGNKHLNKRYCDKSCLKWHSSFLVNMCLTSFEFSGMCWKPVWRGRSLWPVQSRMRWVLGLLFDLSSDSVTWRLFPRCRVAASRPASQLWDGSEVSVTSFLPVPCHISHEALQLFILRRLLLTLWVWSVLAEGQSQLHPTCVIIKGPIFYTFSHQHFFFSWTPVEQTSVINYP